MDEQTMRQTNRETDGGKNEHSETDRQTGGGKYELYCEKERDRRRER